MQTIEQNQNTIPAVEEAKAEFLRAKDRITRGLATTPDDKINWSPSPTARTPIEIVAHAALSIDGIQGMLEGKPFPFSGVDDLDSQSRTQEKTFTTREKVLGVLEEKSATYIEWLDRLTPEQVASTISLPFGSFPMAAAITFSADHLRGHACQIDYIQTIYGDRDWHIGG
jgi:hypothetical protein